MKTIVNIIRRLRVKPAMTVMLFLTGFPGMLLAQHTLQSELNAPREGDVLVRQEITFRSPGVAGQHQVWNFSQAPLVDKDYSVQYFTRDDYGLIGAENGKLLKYNLFNDSLLLYGYENPTTLVKYQQPGLLLKFPLIYGSLSQGYFQGRGKINDRIAFVTTGEIVTLSDGFGSIVLSEEETLEHVVRVHVRKTETNRYYPIPSSFDMDEPVDTTLYAGLTKDMIVTDSYQWYESGYRYPVFETVISYRQTENDTITLEQSSFFYHPYDQSEDLPEDLANQEIQEALQTAKTQTEAAETDDPWAGLTCSLSPNPATDKVLVKMYLPQKATIKVQLHNRMGGIVLDKNEGTYPEGNCQFLLNVKDLPTENYVLDIWLNEHLVSEVLMKR